MKICIRKSSTLSQIIKSKGENTNGSEEIQELSPVGGKPPASSDQTNNSNAQCCFT